MSAENSRTYSTDDDAESNYGAMESVHNSGAEDGASDGAGMDSEKIRHGKLSLNNELETDDDSNDSSSHTPAQKSKRRRHLAMSPPKSPLPIPPEPELEPFQYDSLSDSAQRRRTGFRRPRRDSANPVGQCCELEYRSKHQGAYLSRNCQNNGGLNVRFASCSHAET